MEFFRFLSIWYNDHGPISLPPLPLFDGLPLNPFPGGDNGGGIVAPGEPIPVEPDGGIGNGGQPLPGSDGDSKDDEPIPVEPDGGIGDGAGPIPSDDFDTIITGGGEGTPGNDLFEATDEAETFVFASGSNYDAITGFDLAHDTLDLSQTNFENVKDVIAASSDAIDHVTAFNQLDEGIVIKTGGGAYGYIEGVTLDDLENMNIIFSV